jgi:hypothetical protein
MESHKKERSPKYETRSATTLVLMLSFLMRKIPCFSVCLICTLAAGAQTSPNRETPVVAQVEAIHQAAITSSLSRLSSALDAATKCKDVSIPGDLPHTLNGLADLSSRNHIFGSADPNHFIRMAESLELVAKCAPDNAVANRGIVDDVASDFRIMSPISERNVVGTVPKMPIMVSVRKDGKDLAGWEIFYMEYFLVHIKDEVGPDSFPEPSSSSNRLTPGRYIFQARSSSGLTSEKKTCTVSEDHTCVLLVN